MNKNLSNLFKKVYSDKLTQLIPVSTKLSSFFFQHKFIASDGKEYFFNTLKEMEAFKTKYKFDKEFNNKLENILGE